VSNAWLPEVSLIDKVLRAVIVYGFLLAALRLTGKRQVDSSRRSTWWCSSSSPTPCRTR
jgi:hypothetical protein